MLWSIVEVLCEKYQVSRHWMQNGEHDYLRIQNGACNWAWATENSESITSLLHLFWQPQKFFLIYKVIFVSICAKKKFLQKCLQSLNVPDKLHIVCHKHLKISISKNKKVTWCRSDASLPSVKSGSSLTCSSCLMLLVGVDGWTLG